jgi:hypothetical protein
VSHSRLVLRPGSLSFTIPRAQHSTRVRLFLETFCEALSSAASGLDHSLSTILFAPYERFYSPNWGQDRHDEQRGRTEYSLLCSRNQPHIQHLHLARSRNFVDSSLTVLVWWLHRRSSVLNIRKTRLCTQSHNEREPGSVPRILARHPEQLRTLSWLF